MERKNVGSVDLDTGELLPAGRIMFIPDRPKIREGWVMAFQDGLLKLAADKSITQQQHRVLLHLLGKLDFENYIHAPQVDIARDLDMQAPHVSAAVAALVKKGVLVRGPKVGRVITLKLNNTVAWRGRVRNLNIARSEQLKRRIKLVVNNDEATRRELEKHGQRRLLED